MSSNNNIKSKSQTTTRKIKKDKEKLDSNRIRELLEEIEMSQVGLADLALDGNAGYLSRIINGKRQCLSLPIALRISRTLGRPVEEVFIYKFVQNEREA